MDYGLAARGAPERRREGTRCRDQNTSQERNAISSPLVIAALLRRQRAKLAAVRLQIEQRGLVEAIEAAHQDRRALDADQLDDRGANRIGPDRRAQRKSPSGGSVFF